MRRNQVMPHGIRMQDQVRITRGQKKMWVNMIVR